MSAVRFNALNPNTFSVPVITLEFPDKNPSTSRLYLGLKVRIKEKDR